MMILFLTNFSQEIERVSEKNVLLKNKKMIS